MQRVSAREIVHVVSHTEGQHILYLDTGIAVRVAATTGQVLGAWKYPDHDDINKVLAKGA
jgi:hypothetical protein